MSYKCIPELLIMKCSYEQKYLCILFADFFAKTYSINHSKIKRPISRQQTDVIYTDFSKAFDRVNHDLLLYKLSCMGFSNNAVRWLKSYLSSRTQQVKFENALSKVIDVPSGVPQGSHLLLLILIYSYIPIM